LNLNPVAYDDVQDILKTLQLFIRIVFNFLVDNAKVTRPALGLQGGSPGDLVYRSYV